MTLAAYSLYDLLRILVEKTAWTNEEEKNLALISIAEAEKIGALSRVAEAVVCQHNNIDRQFGKCTDCGKRGVATPENPLYRRTYY